MSELSVWEACRLGDLSSLKKIHDVQGDSILYARHPTPPHILQIAQEEAEWKDHKGSAHRILLKGGHWTPLHVACAYRQIDIVEYLLSFKSVSVDHKDSFVRYEIEDDSNTSNKKEITSPWNSLHWAAHVGDLSLLRILLQKIQFTDVTKSTLCSILQYTTCDSIIHPTGDIQKQLVMWGSGNQYCLANGTTNSRSVPCTVQNFLNMNVEFCKTTKYYSIAACRDRNNKWSLWSWGIDKAGCLGLGIEGEIIPIPTKIKMNIKIVNSLALGPEHACIVTNNGYLFTFGSGKYGKLGHGHTDNFNTPMCVSSLLSHPIKMVAAGENHTIALTMKGEVYTWGCGERGQTGLNLLEDSYKPKKVPSLIGQEVNSITAAGSLSIVLLDNHRKIMYFGLGRSSAKSIQIRTLGKDQTITSFSCGFNFMAFSTSIGKAYYSNWNIFKSRRTSEGDLSIPGLSPFQEINLKGSSARFVTCSNRKLFLYDKSHHLWEFNDLPSLEPTNCFMIDRVKSVSCSDYHYSSVLSQSQENRLIHIVPSLSAENFEDLFTQSWYSDLEIISNDDIKFPVHSFLLEYQIPKSNIIDILSFIKQHIPGDTLKILLRSIYSNSIPTATSNEQSIVLEDFCKRFNYHPTKSYLNLFIQENTYFDFKIQTKGAKIIHCHKAILCARSEYFRGMLVSGMKESVDSFVMISYSYDAVKCMIEYFYNDSISSQTPPNVLMDVILLSNEYLLDRLKQQCELYLTSYITLDSVLDLIALGKQFRAYQLCRACYDYILCHLFETIDIGMFSKLNSDIITSVQSLLDQKIHSLKSLSPSKLKGETFILPEYYLKAMEYEFQFDKLKSSLSQTNSPNNNQQSNKVRTLKKKMYQILRIEEKRGNGEKLNTEQKSKMYQKASILQQLSDLTKETTDDILKTMEHDYHHRTSIQSPIREIEKDKDTKEEEEEREETFENEIESIDTKDEDLELDEIEVTEEIEEKEKIKNEVIDIVLPSPIEIPNEISPNESATKSMNINIPNSSKKRKRKRNNSTKRTFSLTSPSNSKPQPIRQTTSPIQIKQEPKQKGWGSVSPSGNKMTFSDIQKEQQKKKVTTTPPLRSASISPKTGWNVTPPKEVIPMKSLIEMEPKRKTQRNQRKQRGNNRNQRSPITSPSNVTQKQQVNSKPKSKPKSLKEIMEEEESKKEEASRKPLKIREIMGQELTEKLFSSDSSNSDLLEQQLLELAIQASLEEQ